MSWVNENTWNKSGQEVLSQRVSEAIGFDFEAGRRDSSTHPFCGGLPTQMMCDGQLDIRKASLLDHYMVQCMKLGMVCMNREDLET